MPKFIAKNEGFTCNHCGKTVTPIIYGGSYRNHCPFCLWSKHVDGPVPGDRVQPCHGLMEPVGVTTRRTGEFVLLHRCTICHQERYNRIAGDDDTDLLSQLSGEPIK